MTGVDLSEFLLARIAEDEVGARAAFTDGWRPINDVDELRVDHRIPIRTARHVKAWQPRRVLAECEAKRRVVEDHARRFEIGGETHDAQTLRLLALPYADQPGYREEWRP